MVKHLWWLLVGLLMVSPASAATQAEALARVESYLNQLTTVVADFTQTAPDGSISSGTFYWQRPGKMRWEYEPPTPIVIYGNGSELIYFDKELAQTTHIPMSSTPAGLLARDPIRFDDSVVIEEVDDHDGVLRVSMHQAGKTDEGKLALEFSDVPFQLRNLVLTDATGQVTTIALSNARFGERLDPELFTMRQPNALRER